MIFAFLSKKELRSYVLIFYYCMASILNESMIIGGGFMNTKKSAVLIGFIFLSLNHLHASVEDELILADMENKRAELLTVNKKVNEQNKEIGVLVAQSDSLKSKIEGEDTDLQKMQALAENQIIKNELEITRLNNEILKNKEKLAEVLAKKLKNESELSQNSLKLQKYKKENEQLSQELDLNLKAIEQQKKEIAKVEENLKLQKIKYEKDMELKRNKNAEQDLLKVQQEKLIAQFRLDNEKAKQEIADLDKKQVFLIEAVKNSESELVNAKADNLRNKESINQMQATQAKWAKQLEKLAFELTEVKKEHEVTFKVYSEVKSQHEKKLAVDELEVSKMQKELSKLKDEIIEFKKQRLQLEKSLSLHEKRYQEVKTEYARLINSHETEKIKLETAKLKLQLKQSKTLDQ